MASFNQVTLLGNLTREPELRYLPTGNAVCRLGLAVNRRWKNDAGEDQEEVTFIDVDAWGKQAETLAKYCKKGDPLFVTGRLKLDTWTDKATNEKRQKLGVVLEGFQFLTSRKAELAPASPAQRAAADGAGPALTEREKDDVPL